MNKLNLSIKHHLFIGFFLSIWIFSFAFFIRPFEKDYLTYNWTAISIGFGLIAFPCYAIVALLQRVIYQRFLRWHIGFELFMLLLFYLLYSVGTYLYAISPIFNGGIYTFPEFFYLIIFKPIFIFTPIILLARIYLIRLIPVKEDKITITGENKLDILKIRPSDLICITNAHNYVEIFFMEGGQLSSKLIRSSLKTIKEDWDFLIQVHRSHLINPIHFKSWKDANTILLTQIEIPVSKNYRHHVLSL
ncbi:LytTR family DNA-binding domain-containing protein [Spongiimicrobium salis]|uniref:LytTR family DNA-binding domain-containing protein n=1 Tax=Spongiimicrobium salis TaxID=1667022 RepID=UPI00374CFE4C